MKESDIKLVDGIRERRDGRVLGAAVPAFGLAAQHIIRRDFL
jgi:hypothetical protein